MVTAYQPNFAHARVRSRVKKVLNFVELYVSRDQTHWIASSQLYQVFGNTSRPLGRYLKELVLETVDPFYNPLTHTCQQYRLRPHGVTWLQAQTGLGEFVPQVEPVLEQQLTSGRFDYQEKSDRLWNPLQQLSRSSRNRVLNTHGYCYHYDIEAAAPTLLLQRARSLNPDLAIPALSHYVQARTQVRRQIADQTGCTHQQIKDIINAVLQGAVVSSWPHSSVFRMLNWNRTQLQALQQCQEFQAIQQDIRRMWCQLRSEIPVRIITGSNGRPRRARLSGADKSGLYRQIESQVGQVIRRTLRGQRIRFLWIHDGWCSDQIIDPQLVRDRVRQRTGYQIQIDWSRSDRVE
jgi:hypothetical protein